MYVSFEFPGTAEMLLDIIKIFRRQKHQLVSML